MFITKLDRSKKKMQEDFKSIRIDPALFGGLTSYEEINNAFEEMCREERNKLATNFEEEKNEKDYLRTSTNFVQMTNSRSDDLGEKRPSLSQNSSGLVQTPNKRLAFVLGSSPEMMKEFGVDFGMLKKLGGGKKKAAKQVLAQMKEKIKEDLEELLEKQRQRENDEGLKELKRAYSSLKTGSEMQKKDIFWWMKVPTKSFYLKKKLRAKIVEHIGDGENYAKVKEALEEKKRNNGDLVDYQGPKHSYKNKSPHSILSSVGGTPLGIPRDGIYQENTKLLLDNISFDSTLILDEFNKFMKNTAMARRKGSGQKTRLQSRKGSLIISSSPWSEKKQKPDDFSHTSSTVDAVSGLKSHGSSERLKIETNQLGGLLGTYSKPHANLMLSAPHSTPSLNTVNYHVSLPIPKGQVKHQIKEEIVERKIDRLNYKPDLENIVDKMNKMTELREEDKWNERKEKDFLQRRSKSRFQLTYLCNSSSWNDVAFGKMVNEIRYNDANKNYRNNLIDKYMHGEWLTEAEIRYVAITSECLNQFLDREYFNQALEILDEEVIDNIEMNLAENIIKEYKTIRKLIYDSRSEFVKKLTREKAKKIQEFCKKQEAEASKPSPATLKRNQIKMRKKVQETKEFLQKKEEKNKEQKKTEVFSINIIDNKQPLRTAGLKSSSSIGRLGSRDMKESGFKGEENDQLSLQWKEFLKRNFCETIKSCFYGTISKSDFVHLNHPHSKVIRSMSRGVEGEAKLKRHDGSKRAQSPQDDKVQKEIEKFRLKIGGIRFKEGSKDIFKRTFSGGPLELGNNKVEKHSAAKKIKAAVVIQKAIRMILAKKKVKALRQEHKKMQESLRKGSFQLIGSMTSLNIKKTIDPIIGFSNHPKFTREGSGATHFNKSSSLVETKLEGGLNYTKSLSKQESLLRSGKSLVMQSFDWKNSNGKGGNEGWTSVRTPKRLSIGGAAHLPSVPVFKKLSVELNSLLKNKQLVAATKENHMERVKSLTFNYSSEDINVKDNSGNCPLWYGAKHGNLEMCKWLLERGAETNMVCSEGTTPMHMAFASQNPYVSPCFSIL